MGYTFCSISYSNRNRMLDAVAEIWITVDGMRSSEIINELLSDPVAGKSETMARECIEAWGVRVKFE